MREVIVVESPTKAHILELLMKDKKVITIPRHYKRLPKTSLGISFPDYTPALVFASEDARMAELQLKKECDSAVVYIATDPDTIGDVNAHFIYSAVKKSAIKTCRAKLFELTSKGVEEGMNTSSAMKEGADGCYESYIGRKITDRLIEQVVFPKIVDISMDHLEEMSRLTILPLAIIVEREAAIESSKREQKNEKPFYKTAIVFDINSEEHLAISEKEFVTEDEAISFLESVALEDMATLVKENENRLTVEPPHPLTTVTLLMAADRLLGIGATRAINCISALYEKGLVTQVFTDSNLLAESFISSTQLLANKIRHGLGVAELKSLEDSGDRKGAIRPSGELIARMQSKGDIKSVINEVAEEFDFDEDQAKMLHLTTMLTVASCSKSAVDLSTTTIFDVGGEQFVHTGIMCEDLGFRILFQDMGWSRAPKIERIQFENQMQIENYDVTETQKKIPRRFTQGDLIRLLDKNGITQPEIIAESLKAIQDDFFVKTMEGKLHPTMEAVALISQLKEIAPWLTDIKDQIETENMFDEVGRGALQYVAACKAVHEKMGGEIPEPLRGGPTMKQKKFAELLSKKHGVKIPKEAKESFEKMKEWIKRTTQKESEK